MHPKNLSIFDYTYHLPDERIAKYPLAERDMSKLLVYKNGNIQTSVYRDLDEHLPEDCLLVFNNTKVVEARLLFKKETGAVIEVFCLEPHEQYGDISSAMLQKGKVLWKCLIGGASKWKHGMKLKKIIPSAEKEVILEAAIVDRLSDCFIVKLSWLPEHFSFAELLHVAGAIPLPPYLHREVEKGDKERYQTIFAKHEGSVAAPTAGLHFTDAVFAKLAVKNIHALYVTLHVGAGTFKPVKSETMAEHEMHAEWIDVPVDAIEQLIEHADKTIVAVGTTSFRTIESLYWIGVKLMENGQKATTDDVAINQWEPYEFKADNISAKDALTAVLQWMKANDLRRIITKTQILIAPGYKLKVAKGIITNFHQPQSTLLLLVAAIIGNDWKKIYDYALQHGYRFLSYGDGCLLWK